MDNISETDVLVFTSMLEEKDSVDPSKELSAVVDAASKYDDQDGEDDDYGGESLQYEEESTALPQEYISGGEVNGNGGGFVMFDSNTGESVKVERDNDHGDQNSDERSVYNESGDEYEDQEIDSRKERVSNREHNLDGDFDREEEEDYEKYDDNDNQEQHEGEDDYSSSGSEYDASDYSEDEDEDEDEEDDEEDENPAGNYRANGYQNQAAHFQKQQIEQHNQSNNNAQRYEHPPPLVAATKAPPLPPRKKHASEDPRYIKQLAIEEARLRQEEAKKQKKRTLLTKLRFEYPDDYRIAQWDMDTPLTDLEYEIHKRQTKRDEDAQDKLVEEAFITAVSVFELLVIKTMKLYKFIELRGWSKAVTAEIEKYRPHLRAIRLMYMKKGMGGHPIQQISIALVMSAFAFHFKNVSVPERRRVTKK